MNLHLKLRRAPTSLKLSTLMAIIVFAAGESVAASPTCHFGAFVQESDQTGLNVRDKPGLAGKVLGQLPSMIESLELPGYKVRVEVNVVEGADGWVRVQGANDNTSLTGRPARPMFTGSGWVAARKLAVKSQAAKGYAVPNANSAASVNLNDGGSFDGDGWMNAAQLITCQGDWALVEVNDSDMPADVRSGYSITQAARAGLPAGKFRVWLNHICGNQETGCDNP